MKEANTLRGGLIGAHISRTRLPAALSLLCVNAGLALEFELIDTAEDVDFDLSACLAACRDKGWNGVSVTHPHKIGTFEWLNGNQTDDVAKVGSVNMVVFRSSSLPAFFAAKAATYVLRDPSKRSTYNVLCFA